MTSDAPGWDAIDAALERLYPGVEPKHFATLIKWRLGGPDPLDGISYYPRLDPVPHWHIVSYGMTELYEKVSETAEESGWGFEFTFRLRRDPADEDPPIWAANFLQNLARYVFETGNWFEVNHHMDLNGPIALDRETLIRAIAFTEDPELGTIETPHGVVQFLQIVGLTPDEYAATQAWSVRDLLDLLAERLPLLVTDLDRGSATDDPDIAEAVEEGRRRDGSATGTLAVAEFAWRPDGDLIRLVVGAHIAERVALTLLGRLPFGRPLTVNGPESTAVFTSGSYLVGAEEESSTLEVVLTVEALDGLVSVLIPEAGVRAVPAAESLIVEITRSGLRDSDGNVVETVG
ncbi:suppressor of fused domain protein [Dactylosporangium sp. AC04546]|uniref:suppressor of fused domain protein n=1 Tax=Dactylosporangium sp. AC04546 TaxID=2862460 RepID=UPI001EDD3B42|nr:suppressor of fused domain protein [Dactylosporangium sp. AC04546]WVK83513.1 suppressor of fused domain protein [Dactylosporangium sp. AC04546]